MTIQGNLADASAVVIQCTQAVECLTFDQGTAGITLRSFTVNGTSSHLFGAAIYVVNFGAVYAQSLIMGNIGNGVFAAFGGRLYVDNSKAFNCFNGMGAVEGAEVYAYNTELRGLGTSSGNGLVALNGARILGDGIVMFQFARGLNCDAVSSIPAGGMQFNSVSILYDCAIHG